MAKNIDRLLQWINDEFKFANTDNYVSVTDEAICPQHGVVRSRVKIYTDNNVYSIVVGENTDEKAGFIMGFASSRKPRAGEDWTRGNDIYDGPFTKDTWYRLLADIVSYEMVKVHKTKEAPIPSVPELPGKSG